MPIKRGRDIKQQLRALKKIESNIPKTIGVVAVNSFKRNFNVGGFIDLNLQPWKPRKRPDRNRAKRATLVKSGALKRSVRVIKLSRNAVTIGSDKPYAQVHNEGGGKNIPQRQFIGESRAILIQADRTIQRQLKKIFN